MILITGSTGFLGKYLLKKLSKTNIQFRCLTRKRNIKNKFEIVGNILEPKSLNAATNGCSLVIHLANLTHGKHLREVNIIGTKNLINSCKKNKVQNFIYISSTAVIDGDRNEYVESKIECEKIVKTSGLNFVILRPSMMFGKGDTKNYALVSQKIAKSKLFFINSAGKCLIHPVWVDDVASGIVKCITLNRFNGQTHTFAAEKPILYNDFIKLLNKRLGYPAKVIYLPHFITEPKAKITDLLTGRERVKQNDRVYDLSNEKRELGYKPHSIEEILSM